MHTTLKIFSVAIIIFVGVVAALNDWMFLASICAILLLIIATYFIRALLKASSETEPCEYTESFWHNEINQN